MSILLVLIVLASSEMPEQLDPLSARWIGR